MRSTEVSSTGTWGTDYEAGTGSSKIFLPGFLEKSPGGSDLPFGIRALVSFEYPDHGGHRGLPHAGAGGGAFSLDLRGQYGDPFKFSFAPAAFCGSSGADTGLSLLPDPDDAEKWLAGELLYVAAATLLYTGFMLLSTVLLCMKNSYVGDVWSETAAMLAYSKLGEDLSVPSTVKVMESMPPYFCMLQVAALIFLYSLCLSFVILAGNLIFKGNKGMIAGLFFSGFGFLLDPQTIGSLLGMESYEMYKVNVLTGWISPLSHAVYARHNFGYDRLPTVRQSLAVFGGLLILLVLLSMKALKRYPFTFLGEKE